MVPSEEETVDLAMSPLVRLPERSYDSDGMKMLHKSIPLPAGPLSQTATVYLTMAPVRSLPTASNSTPRLRSLQALELLRYAVTDVAGSVDASVVSEATFPSGCTSL